MVYLALSPLIRFGRSLGSGPTVHLASYLNDEKKIAGVILQSPLSSAIRVVSNKLALIPAVDMFENIKKISKITSPILIMHGTDDEVVPYSHGVELKTKVEGKRLWKFLSLAGAGHNNIESEHSDELLETLSLFVKFLDNPSKGEEKEKIIENENTID